MKSDDSVTNDQRPMCAIIAFPFYLLSFANSYLLQCLSLLMWPFYHIPNYMASNVKCAMCKWKYTTFLVHFDDNTSISDDG